MTRESGTDDPRWSTSAVLFDYPRDGDLDLAVANYVDFTFRNNKRCFSPAGEPDYCTPKAYSPLRSRLFKNDGRGRFEDVTLAAGLSALAGPSLGVTATDFNGDGCADLYVANDGAANFLWLGKGDGTFEEAGPLSGAAYGMDGIARAGMGVAAGDFDDDGDLDLFVTNLVREGSVLFRNDGHGNFQDVSLPSGIGRASFLVTGFGAGWLDYDDDGRLDLFAANGAVTRMPAQRGARVAVLRAGQAPLWRLAHTDGSYLSACDSRAHFGLGASVSIEGVLVQWPSGAIDRWNQTEVDRQITLRQGTGEKRGALDR